MGMWHGHEAWGRLHGNTGAAGSVADAAREAYERQQAAEAVEERKKELHTATQAPKDKTIEKLNMESAGTKVGAAYKDLYLKLWQQHDALKKWVEETRP